MQVYHKQLSFKTKGNKPTYYNVLQECQDFVKESGVKQGILVVQSPHTTCGVFYEEYVHDINALEDEYLQEDLNKGLNLVFPKQLTYGENYKYPGILHLQQGFSNPNSELSKNPAILLNGDAHLKATLVGSDCTLILQDQQILNGKYGSIYFVDYDGNRARERKCNLCIIGG